MFLGIKPQTYFKQKMNKVQSKLTSMIALNKVNQQLALKKEKEESLQERTILNKLQETLTLPKISEYVHRFTIFCDMNLKSIKQTNANSYDA